MSADQNNNDSNTKKEKASKWRNLLSKFKKKKTLALAAVGVKESKESRVPDSDDKKAKKPGWFRRWLDRKKSKNRPQAEDTCTTAFSQEQAKTDEPLEQSKATWTPKRRAKSEFSGEKIKNFFKIKFKKSKESAGRPGSKESNVEFDQNNNTEGTQFEQSTRRTNANDESQFGSKRQRRASTEDGFSTSFKKKFKKLKADNMENFKVMKTFFAQEVKDRTMQRAVARVEAKIKNRKEGTNTSESTSSALHQGDDLFPVRKPHQKKESGEGQGGDKGAKPTPHVAPPPKPVITHPHSAMPTDMTHLPLINCNNDNNGQLFLASGKPFWHGKGKSDVDDDEKTDDELAMNTDMLTEIAQGKVTLTPMPNLTLVLDRFRNVDDMIKIDDILFTRDIIFSNTMRTLMNLDESAHKKSVKRDPSTLTQSGFRWELPKDIYRYSNRTEIQKQPFVPQTVDRK